jgi:hypothetical protein
MSSLQPAPESDRRREASSDEARLAAVAVETTGRRLYRFLAGWAIEGAIFLAIVVVYQLTKWRAAADPALAMEHGQAVIALERRLGLFFEPSVHAFFRDRTELMPLLRILYIHLHFPVVIAFLVWLRSARAVWYPRIRNGFALAHLLALAMFMAYPCAGPRFFAEYGFADLLALPYENSHNPYAVIPSMHYGYASLVGLGLLWLGRSVWLRGLGVLYLILVLLVIVATAAHFWLDAPLGTLVVVVGLAASGAFRSRTEGRCRGPGPGLPGSIIPARPHRRGGMAS